jgi:hypothetical protein
MSLSGQKYHLPKSIEVLEGVLGSGENQRMTMEEAREGLQDILKS